MNMKDKVINKLKLFVTTDCNMSCKYCMIKNTNEYMTFDLAIKWINYFILNTKNDWNKKFIYFFGWEPFKNFNLIKKIINYINLQKLKFPLEYVICTNLTILNNEYIFFLKNNNIKLSISLWGYWKYHTSHRIFKTNSNVNSLNITLKNIKLLKKGGIQTYKLWIGFVILKDFLDMLFTNFIYIVEVLSLCHLNFEIIIDKKEWSMDDYNNFKNEYNKIIRYIICCISKKKYIYLNNLNWTILFLLYDISKNDKLSYLAELYPNWNIMFSWFNTYLSTEEIKKTIVWNLNKDSFIDVNYSDKYAPDFNSLENFKPGVWYRFIKDFMNVLDLEIAKIIIKRSKEELYFKEYIDNVKKYYF